MKATSADTPVRTLPVVIRPIDPTDAPALQAFYASLSEDSRTLRFLGWTRGLSPSGTRNFCTADHHHREGFVAVLHDPGRAGSTIVGHLCIEPDEHGSAEVAIAVADAWQGRGLGHRLMDRGVTWARENGIRTFTASTFVSNTRLLRLVRALGLPVCAASAGANICDLTIELDRNLPAAA